MCCSWLGELKVIEPCQLGVWTEHFPPQCCKGEQNPRDKPASGEAPPTPPFLGDSQLLTQEAYLCWMLIMSLRLVSLNFQGLGSNLPFSWESEAGSMLLRLYQTHITWGSWIFGLMKFEQGPGSQRHTRIASWTCLLNRAETQVMSFHLNMLVLPQSSCLARL